MEGSYDPMDFLGPPSLLDGFEDTMTNATNQTATDPSISQPSRRPRNLPNLLQSRLERQRRADDTSDDPGAAVRPPGRIRSKRKASSPSDPPPPRSMARPLQSQPDVPIIETKDILSTNEVIPPVRFESEIIELSSDSSDNDDNLPRPTSSALRITRDRRQQIRDIPESYLRSRAALTRKDDSAPKKLSAVLITRETAAPAAADADETFHSFRYLPLRPATTRLSRSKVEENALLTVLPDHQEQIRNSDRFEPSLDISWPLHRLPVELFDLITSYLSRDDVKSMRLVNREFEQKVSRSLFYTSVVPFNTELYDMIDEDKRNIGHIVQSASVGKGKAKVGSLGSAISLSQTDAPLKWQNATEDKDGKVYRGYGLRVFRGFGPRIKRFGMSFEVSEKQLSQPMTKKELDHFSAYHGSYDWPSQQYTRFAKLAGLENTADESSRMKAAFSHLEIVQELALSVDSGLGWLNGPDKSVRARLFEKQSPVFGTTYDVPDHATQAAVKFWAALQQSQLAFDPHSDFKEIKLVGRKMTTFPHELAGLKGDIYGEVERWPVMHDTSLNSPERLPQIPYFGVVFTTNEPEDDEMKHLPLVPGMLRKEQKEWLLETQWAQQAFMESYMLAVIDNPVNFGKVTVLNIAKLSSRFLSMLARPYFWDALPCLEDVTLRVSADWRSVDKDDAGVVVANSAYPSDAIRAFYKDILRDRVSSRKLIKKLTIGWVGGGEHAEGIMARNNLLLPAPITQVEHSTAVSGAFSLVFKHVEHLTLSNCWITPPTLEGLVRSHANKALKKLTLDSVSLTAHPKFQPTAHAAIANQNVQLQQAMNALVAHFAGHAGINNAQLAQMQQLAQLHPPGAGPQQVAALTQHWQNSMQQMQQLFQGNLANAGPAQQQAFQNLLNQQVAQQNAIITAANNNPHALNNWNFPPLAAAPQAVGINAIPPAPPPPPAVTTVNTGIPQTPSNHWTANHREGSWPYLLNTISPGPIFTDYLPAPEPWEPQHPEREPTNLQTLELISCGYARLPRLHTFDQTALISTRGGLSSWFARRQAALGKVMMELKDKYLGQIVQEIPAREMDALRFAWGLREGWEDEQRAEEGTYDGCLPGGTGRITGTIWKGMGLGGGQVERDGAADGGAVEGGFREDEADLGDSIEL